MNSLGVPNSQFPIVLGNTDSTSGLLIDENNSNGYFSICAGGVPGTAGFVYPFYKNGAIYSVTASLKFKVRSMMYFGLTTATNMLQLMSDTVTFSEGAAVGTLTAPKYQFGVSGTYGMPITASGAWVRMGLTYEFAATTFPGIQIGQLAFASVVLIGKEEA